MSRTRIEDSEEDEEAPSRKKSRKEGEPQYYNPCCSCSYICETSKGRNWLNMGPDLNSSPRFWNTIQTHIFVDWEKSYVGHYGTFLPFCKTCMKSLRCGLKNYVNEHPEIEDSTAIAISMLSEQIYHKVRKISSPDEPGSSTD